MTFNPLAPILLIKNISKYAVNIFGRVKLRPGETKDIYSELEYEAFGSLTSKIIKELENPEGELYLLWKVRRHIEILEFQNPNFAGSGIEASALSTSNDYFEGAVLGFEGGELIWRATSSSPSGPASGDLAGTYPGPSLATTGVTSGTYGTVTAVPRITVDAKGRVLVAENLDIVFPETAEPIGPASGDLSGSYPAPTVSGLQGRNLPDVAPAIGQVLQFNGADWVPGAIPSGGSGGGGVIYFFNNDTAPDIPTTGLTAPNIKEMNTSPDLPQTSSTRTNLSTGGTYDEVIGFVTDLNIPGTPTLPAGIWDFNIWASSSATISGECLTRIKVYKYDGVSPILLVTSNPISVVHPQEVFQYIVSIAFPQTTISAADRIYVVLEATATSTGTSVTFYFGDETPSHTHTTIPSVVGSGIVHVINGVFQSPASPVALDSSEVSGILPASAGGTGVSSADNGEILIGNGTDFTLSTLSEGTGIAITNGSGSVTIGIDSATLSDIDGKAERTTSIIAGAGLTGGGDLSADRTLSMQDVGTPGTFASASQVPVITTDAQGRVTSVVETNIAISGSQVTSGVVAVANGGTGLSSLPSAGQLLIGNGTGFTEATLTAGPGITITNGAGSIAVNNAGVTSFSGGSTGLTPAAPTTGSISLGGVLAVANGGTGLSSPGASGNLLVSNGTGFVSTLPQAVFQSIYRTVIGSEPNPSPGVPGIRKGDVVYVLNSNGQFPGVRKAIASAVTTSYSALGIAYEDIFNNTSGTIVTEGLIGGAGQNIDTQGMVQGAPLFLSATTAGRFTDVRPTGTNFPVEIGICVQQGSTNGVVYVRPNYTRLSDHQSTIVPNTQNPYTVAASATIPLSAFISCVYLPISTAGGANVTLGNTPIESPPNNALYWGKELWLHNIDNNRSITIPFVSNGNTWVEGNVNLVLPSKSMVKFIWTTRGSGGAWVQTSKAVQAG